MNARLNPNETVIFLLEHLPARLLELRTVSDAHIRLMFRLPNGVLPLDIYFADDGCAPRADLVNTVRSTRTSMS
jgi:hypothetical protein